MVLPELTLLWTGTMAILFSGASVVGRERNVAVLVLGDAMAILFWMVFAINAFAFKIVTSGVEVITNAPALGWVGFAATFIMVVDLLWALGTAVGESADEDPLQETPR